MTGKKDFSNINTNRVYGAIAAATEDTSRKKYKDRKTYTEEEALEALESLKTSGKKGVKLPRINLAFTPANYEFIKTMAQVRGQNLTEFINDIIAEARTTHSETYQKAIEFRNSL